MFRISSIDIDDAWLLIGVIGEKRLSVVFETRSGKRSVDDDENRSNQMFIIFQVKKELLNKNLSDELDNVSLN